MKRKQRWGIMLLAVLTAAAVLAGGSWYIFSLQNSIWEQSVTDVLEVTSQGSHAFEIYIEDDMKMLHNLAGNLSQDASRDFAAIQSNLTLYGESQDIYMVIDLEHGVMYSNRFEGGMKLTKEQLNLYESLDSQGIREPYLNEYTGQNTLGYYERFTFADGTSAIVQKDQLVSELSKEFSLSFYENSGFSYIVNKDGDILIRSQHRNSNRTFPNIFDVIEANDNSRDIIDTFRTSLSNGNQGVARLNFDSEEYIFAYVPIDHTDGWYLISIIPNSAIMEQANQILNTSQILLMVLAAVGLILTIFLLLMRQSRKSVREKELEIQYREQLFNILANNTNDVFLMLLPEDFSVEYVSPNVERVLGIPQKTVKADLSSIGLPANNEEPVSYAALSEIEVGESIVREGERIHKASGERRWFVETVYRATVDTSDRFIVVLSDRTAERQSKYALEEALEIARVANQSKSTFLSNMSHDIRTPMNAIVGFTTLLQRDASNPERVREHARKIAASSQHLLSLINDVLDMSKIESGKTTLNISDICLSELIAELATIIRPQAKAKHQTFEISIADIETEHQTFEISIADIETEHLLGDKLRISQILINILSNAVKYTPVEGNIKLSVRQLPQKAKNYARLRFIVSDNGIGMSEEYLDTIFQPFTREVSSDTNKIQGTGLGMAITKNLVDLMGGVIAVESRQGEGSTFTVDLNLRIRKQDTDQVAGTTGRKPVQEQEHILQGMHFLVAEDNELNSEILTELLDMEGATCKVTENGRKAAEIFEQSVPGEYDMILMDIQMPVMNGYEATMAIRAGSHPLAKTIPIIAMTANAFTEDVKASLDAGMNAHIAKPVDMKQLETAIRDILSGEPGTPPLKTSSEPDTPPLETFGKSDIPPLDTKQKSD